MVQQIRISGAGGQGVILAGTILAEATGIFEGKTVVQARDYGGAMRGGAARSDVLIDDASEEIDYPVVTSADFLLAMTQEAADKWTPAVNKDGIILYDATNVLCQPVSSAHVYSVPITSLAQQNMGRVVGANVIAIGIMQKLTNMVSEDAVKKALLRRVPSGTEEYNIKALEIGFKTGQELAC
jgi:2-oxoglutarate ferredoxin oxidoreductase subunit gamma